MSDQKLLGQHSISSLQQLKDLALLLMRQLKPGDIVYLRGDVGVGKTAFTKFLGKALGVIDEITSPTYTIMAEYPVHNNLEIHRLIHLDLYRAELDTNYVHEIVQTATEQKAVVVIEWPEKVNIKLTERWWNIVMKTRSDKTTRIITVTQVQ